MTATAPKLQLDGHPLEAPVRSRLLGYTQTHDQIGNRPRGERFSTLVDAAVVRQAAALVLLGPFVPMLFQGEEWAASTPFLYFTQHADAGLARDVKEGREREYLSLGFSLHGAVDPESEEAFTRSRLRWEERDLPAHRAIFDWYRALARLRREAESAGELPLRVEFDEPSWLVLERGRFVVALCFADEPREIPLTADAELLLSSGDADVLPDRVRVAAHGVAVLRKNA